MPLFAFANAGVRILGNGLAAVMHPVSLGVVLGLVIGKPLGIWFFACISAKTGWGTRPAELSWGKIFGAGCLSGIGFTMSLFIAGLAFGEGALLDMSKIGTMTASLAAGIAGSMILLRKRSLSNSPAESVVSCVRASS